MPRKVEVTSGDLLKETVPIWVFVFALGTVGALLCIIFSHFDKAQDKNDTKMEEMNNRLTRIETRIELSPLKH